MYQRILSLLLLQSLLYIYMYRVRLFDTWVQSTQRVTFWDIVGCTLQRHSEVGCHGSSEEPISSDFVSLRMTAVVICQPASWSRQTVSLKMIRTGIFYLFHFFPGNNFYLFHFFPGNYSIVHFRFRFFIYFIFFLVIILLCISVKAGELEKLVSYRRLRRGRWARKQPPKGMSARKLAKLNTSLSSSLSLSLLTTL